MGVTRIELRVELREHELVIADTPARHQQGIAQGRTMPLAMDFRVLAEHLAQ